ncbi:phage tail protein [Aminobacter niigataensis]|uniref:phage tail protein n=1 Tax=Aminobacter niigataensis TaxID=83265 RepID=UPI0024C97B0F|nr:phage tail protein [Aminobacter niigataensis]CAI2936165.1 Collar domain-containing protein [Aminobacter niigataensis]
MEYVLPRNTPEGNNDPELPYWNEARQAGVTGSIPPDKFFTHTQMEIVNAIKDAGLTPTGADLTQLAQAIRAMIAAEFSGGQTTIEVPPGIIAPYAGNAAPTGWLKCNGQLVSRETYSALFGAISTAWGVGDGATTFALPDLRGEFIRGWDDGRGVDAGRAFATFQADELKAHTHGYQQIEIIGNGERDNNAQAGVNFTAANTASTGGSETRPRNRAALYIIKT